MSSRPGWLRRLPFLVEIILLRHQLAAACVSEGPTVAQTSDCLEYRAAVAEAALLQHSHVTSKDGEASLTVSDSAEASDYVSIGQGHCSDDENLHRLGERVRGETLEQAEARCDADDRCHGFRWDGQDNTYVLVDKAGSKSSHVKRLRFSTSRRSAENAMSVCYRRAVRRRSAENNSKRMEVLRSTPEGICMYTLPSRFNTGLLDQWFHEPESKSVIMEYVMQIPPLRGITNASQFVLDWIFYDRMNLAANQERHFGECKLFYVPYFVGWETDGRDGKYGQVNRSELDRELFSHLVHFNSTAEAGSNHFIVVSRTIWEANVFLQHPSAMNMIKLPFENMPWLGDPFYKKNVHPIPYATWFRYYPDLEQQSPSTITVLHSESIPSDAHEEQCMTPMNLTQQLQAECDGREFCSIFIPSGRKQGHAGAAICDHDVVGSYKCGEGPPFNFGTQFRKSAVLDAAADNQSIIWQTDELYRTPVFTSAPGATGNTILLSCQNGPCWLSGNCTRGRMRQVAADGGVQPGPFASVIGSFRPNEVIRGSIIEQCLARPSHCVYYATGSRENFTLALQDRIRDMYQLIMASTFCINAPGDTPTRKAIFDALVLGCIPVIITEESLSQYPLHLPHWENVSLVVPNSTLQAKGFNIFDHLANYTDMHPEDVSQKQAAIRNVAYSLQYSWTPAYDKHGPDAFDKTLEYLLSIAP